MCMSRFASIRARSIVLLCLSFLFSFTTHLRAGEYQNTFIWTDQTGDGEFYNPGNWVPTVVPFSTNDLIQLNSGKLTFPANAVFGGLDFSGGELAGTCLLEGTMHWTGGHLSGTLVVGTNRNLFITGPGDKFISRGGLLALSGFVYFNQGNLRVDVQNDGDAAIEIRDRALLTVQNTAFLVGSKLRKCAINNGGAIRVTGGNNIVISSMTLNGFNVDGAELTLEDCQVGAPIIVEYNAILNVGSGTVVIADRFRSSGLTRLAGNVTAFLTGNFSFEGGTLTGTMGLSGSFNWLAGDLQAALGIGNLATLNIFGGDTKLLSHGGSILIQDLASIFWTSGNIQIEKEDNAVAIQIMPTCVFDINTDAVIYSTNTAIPLIVNDGTLRKIGGYGITDFNSVAFQSSGTNEAFAGTLNFNAGFLQTAGVTRLSGGAIGGSTLTFTGGLLTGAGNIGANVINGATVIPGGIINITGSYTQTPAGLLRIDSILPLSESAFARLNITGLATLDGTLQVSLATGATFHFGDAFPALTYRSVTGNFATSNFPTLPSALAFYNQFMPTKMRIVAGDNGGIMPVNTLRLTRSLPGAQELRFTAEPDRHYRIQASTNLVDWIDLIGASSPTGFLRCTDPAAGQFDHRFYRAISP
ncbi:MAG: repeat-associated core domain protein [Verrucomicrobiales bacterium]|nr:repeat-associated core domain protein [Verrucomicrobiales bacterium]